jgi:hypothetical protein
LRVDHLAKQYKIVVTLDSGGVAASAARAARAIEQIDEAARRTANGAGKAFQGQAVGLDQVRASAVRAADAQEKGSARAAVAAERAATGQMVGLDQLRMSAIRFGDAREKAAAKAAAAAERAERRAAEAAERELNRTAATAARVQAQRERLADRDAARTQRVVASTLPDEAVEFQARNRMIRENNEARIKGLMEFRRQEQGVFSAGVRGWAAQAAAIGGTLIGLQALIGAAQAYGKAMGAAADEADRMAKGFAEDRDELRELASTLGVTPDNKFAKDFKFWKMQTGMKQGEAIAFQLQMANVGQQFVDEGDLKKNITEVEYKQFRQQAARLAVAQGVEPGVVGDLAGRLLGFRDTHQFGDDANKVLMGQLYAGTKILGRGSGNYPDLLKQSNRLMAGFLNEDALKGTFTDPKQVFASISTMAERDPLEAEVYVRAAIKGIRDVRGKPKAILAKAGIKENTPFFEAIEKLAPVILEEAARTKTDVNTVLGRYFEDEREKGGIGTFINAGIGKGVLKDRMAFGERYESADLAKRDTDKFFGTDVGMKRINDARIEYAEAVQGEKLSRIDVLRREALAGLTQEGKISSTDQKFAQFFAGSVGFDTLATSGRELIDERVRQIINKRTPEGVGDIGSLRYMATIKPEARAELFNDFLDRTEKAGINPLTGEKIDQLVTALNENTKAIQAAQKPGEPAKAPPAKDMGPKGQKPAGAMRP